jgi:hypothetical protein
MYMVAAWRIHINNMDAHMVSAWRLHNNNMDAHMVSAWRLQNNNMDAHTVSLTCSAHLCLCQRKGYQLKDQVPLAWRWGKCHILEGLSSRLKIVAGIR